MPREIVEKYLKVRNGQIFKFYGYTDKVVLVPSNRDANPKPDEIDRYVAEIERMMASAGEKGAGGRKAGGGTAKQDRAGDEQTGKAED